MSYSNGDGPFMEEHAKWNHPEEADDLARQRAKHQRGLITPAPWILEQEAFVMRPQLLRTRSAPGAKQLGVEFSDPWDVLFSTYCQLIQRITSVNRQPV